MAFASQLNHIEHALHCSSLKPMRSSNPSEEVFIQIHEDSTHPASAKPETVTDVFQQSVKQYSDRIALATKVNNSWEPWTYAEYMEKVKQAAKSLIYLELEPFQGIATMGYSSRECVVANLGGIFAGGIATGIPFTTLPEGCYYVLNHCNVSIIFVEDEFQLEKIVQIRNRLPLLKAIVQWSGNVQCHLPGVYGWTEFMALGRDVPDVVLETRLLAQRPGHCCTVLYSSGTTGQPKGIMLSHDNLVWATKHVIKPSFGVWDESGVPPRIVSYRTISHISGQLGDIYLPLVTGGAVYFAENRDILEETLVDVKPTILFAVPRILEDIEERIRSNPVESAIDSDVKRVIGLDKLEMAVTGAAPIPVKTLEFFKSLGIMFYEGYGMTEVSGLSTMNTPNDCKYGTVGKLRYGLEQKIDNPDAEGRGEVCMRGRHLFMGYLHNAEATAAAMDSEGWLHSGDIGQIDSDGFLTITGRIKEIIINAYGHNIAPVPLEHAIKEEIIAVSQAVVVGDKRTHLVALLTLKTEPTTDPSTLLLSEEVVRYARRCGSQVRTVEEAISCKKFQEQLSQDFVRVNARATTIQKRILNWRILPGGLSPAEGTMTETLKLRREVISEKFKDIIDSMYRSDT